MQIALIIVGAIIGLWLGDGNEEILGLAAGAAIGYLLSQLRSLKQQLGGLDARVARLMRDRSTDTPPVSPPQAARAAQPIPAKEPLPEVPPATAQRGVEQPVREAAGAFAEPLKKADWGPGSIARLLAAARGWLTTGNVPVKLGVIVSFFGVAFLLKYAVDQRILVLAIELRLLAVAG